MSQMKYTSLKEYFIKFNNLLFAVLLLPLLVLVIIYWQLQEGNIEGPLRGQQEINQLLLIAFGAIAITDWALSFVLFNRGLQAARKIQSLGVRLDRYYSFTIFRFLLIVSGSIVLAIGFFLTENQLFSLMTLGNIVLLSFFWPRPSKVCNDLLLKGDERTLVLYKKDRLH